MQEILLHVFEHLERKNIQYCLLRGYAELEQLESGGDIDLLVRADQIEQCRAILEQLEFASVPAWGHQPHQFFVAYDPNLDQWLKLDVITTVAFGNPIQAIHTDLAAICLNRRRRREPTFVLSPEDELVTLLLHCVLDKRRFATNRRMRIEELRQGIADVGHLSRLLRSYWSPQTTWPQLAKMIDEGGWEKLLAEGPAVAERLASRSPLAVLGRRISGRVLRKLDRVAGMLRPRSLTVALLAPDGGGKTTLATELTRTFYLPTRYIYMGSHSEEGATALPTTRWIRAYSKRPESSRPGLLWPVVRHLRFANNLLEQWYRYSISYYHRVRGRLVVFDRYAYDINAHGYSKLPLKSRARRWLLSAVAPKPDLIVFLDAPGDVLYARKGEHSPEVLEAQRQHYLRLRNYLPQMIVVDATHDAENVRRTVTSLIWRRYAGLFQHRLARR